jgi:hypothetical protein
MTQSTFGFEQKENLARVTARIGQAILVFHSELQETANRQFHMEELRKYVQFRTSLLAPASADRVLRDLRSKGLIDYEVVNRAQSLYRFK